MERTRIGRAVAICALLAVSLAPAVPSVAASNLGNTMYFVPRDAKHGAELWRTRGTADTTRRVADFGPGGASGLIRVGDGIAARLYFVADDGERGVELWAAEPTSKGARRVRDINRGEASSFPSSLRSVDGRLFFTADDGVHGREPWVSDGTSSGTHLVKNVRAGDDPAKGSSPGPVVEANGLYFVATDGVNGPELWTTDGTRSGTTIVTDFAPGKVLDCCAAVGGGTLFVADDRVHGAELWWTDGTPGSETLVADVSSVAVDHYSPYTPRIQAAVDGLVYFTQDDGTNGTSLYRTDGTEAGTWIVRSMGDDYDSRWPHGFVNLGGELLFVAYNMGVERFELWRTDGTELGTEMIEVIFEGEPSWDVYAWRLLVRHGLLYVGYQTSLYRSDGTPAGSFLLRSFPLREPGEQLLLLGPAGPLVYLQVDDGAHGYALWATDGTKPGTRLVSPVG